MSSKVKLDGRPFEVKRLKTREFTDCRCHILFVTAAEKARGWTTIINLQRTASVLTISEAPDFAQTRRHHRVRPRRQQGPL